MKRETELRIKRILDDYLPPVFRESRFLEFLVGRVIWRGSHKRTEGFREKVWAWDDQQLNVLYQVLDAESSHQRSTDLNAQTVDAIIEQICSGNVLEVGCGRAFLANRLVSEGFDVTASDIVAPNSCEARFVSASATELPFEDNFFVNVICAHTLEHIPDFQRALRELRRVCSGRLIVVLPRERPLRWGPNLHVHFFPHIWSLYAYFEPSRTTNVFDYGDWMIVEDQRSFAD